MIDAHMGLIAVLSALMLTPTIIAGAATDEPTVERAVLQLGPMLGHTSSYGTRIWIKTSAAADSGVIVGEAADLRDGRVVDGPRLSSISDYMGVLEVKDLRPATRYFYRVLIDARAASPLASFVTAPAENAEVRVRFATTSCVGLPEEAKRSWDELAKVPIDLLLRLGDNVYVGSTDPNQHRRTYYAHRQIAAHQAVVRRTPSLGIWDDWDYAGNDSDGMALGKELSLQSFKQFWPNPAYGQASDPGVYFKFSWGDVDFFMLDGRYHRSPNEGRDDGHKTMLGPAQLAWLKRELAASAATFKFVASGSEWQSRGRVDSWRSFIRERDALFHFIDENEVTGVVLLSGDRHVTAGYQVMGRFIEITSGPFGGENHEAPWNPDEMFLLHDKGNFFVVLAVDTKSPDPRLTVEVHEVGRGLVRERHFTWAEINGAESIPTCELLPDCRN